MKKVFLAFAFITLLSGAAPWTPVLQAHAADVSESICSASTFIRDLSFGKTGADVKALQQFLNAKGFTVAATGAGAPGQETSRFGPATKAAVIRFQAAHNIAPAIGYFGPLTRARATALCTIEATTPVVPPVVIGSTPPPVTLPAATSTPATSTPSSINPRSIVGVLCYYRTADDDIVVIKGSGTIIHPEGYVLTAKHAVDPRWTRAMYDDTLTEKQKLFYGSSTLDHCEIGVPEDVTPLPTAAEIRNGTNPPRAITHYFQYRAEPYFIPDRTGLSDTEFKNADFAILRITDATRGCAASNAFCAEFDHFPYSPIGSEMPGTGGDLVATYGYPGGEGPTKNDFYLSGAAGPVAYYLSGNQRFEGKPFNFSLRAEGIKTGRSGSPLYFNNQVIGMLYGSVSESESYNLTIGVIRGILEDHGLGWLLK